MSAQVVALLLLGWLASEIARACWRVGRPRARAICGPCVDCNVVRAAAANGVRLARRAHTCPEGNGHQ